jgi:hypothetical protein
MLNWQSTDVKKARLVELTSTIFDSKFLYGCLSECFDDATEKVPLANKMKNEIDRLYAEEVSNARAEIMDLVRDTVVTVGGSVRGGGAVLNKSFECGICLEPYGDTLVSFSECAHACCVKCSEKVKLQGAELDRHIDDLLHEMDEAPRDDDYWKCHLCRSIGDRKIVKLC